MAIVSALRSLSLNRAFSALLTLMVLLHGTLLAPQLVAGTLGGVGVAPQDSDGIQESPENKRSQEYS